MRNWVKPLQLTEQKETFAACCGAARRSDFLTQVKMNMLLLNTFVDSCCQFKSGVSNVKFLSLSYVLKMNVQVVSINIFHKLKFSVT